MGFLLFFIFLGLFFWLGAAFLVASFGREKEIGFTATFLICIFLSPVVGLVVAICSPRPMRQATRFEQVYEEARKEEFKGHTRSAIDKYMDALFYLHNDFKNIPPGETVARQELIDIIERKVQSLKAASPAAVG